MWPDRVSNLGPLALESDALLTAQRGPVTCQKTGFDMMQLVTVELQWLEH